MIPVYINRPISTFKSRLAAGTPTCRHIALHQKGLMVGLKPTAFSANSTPNQVLDLQFNSFSTAESRPCLLTTDH